MHTAMPSTPRRPIPRVIYSAEHQAVLKWLCEQPAKVHDFADIHDAMTAKGLKILRNRIEPILSDLRHERYGAVLATHGPDGMRLRPRHAYLKADSPARKGYPPVDPLPDDATDHPTLVAVKRAAADKAAQDAAAKAAESARLLQRSEAHGAYRKRKLDARAQAEFDKPPRTNKDRYVTGFADPPTAPGDAPIHPTTAVDPPALEPAPMPKYVKADTKGKK